MNVVGEIKKRIEQLEEQLNKFIKVRNHLDKRIADEDPDKQLRDANSRREGLKYKIFTLNFMKPSASANTDNVVESKPTNNIKIR